MGTECLHSKIIIISIDASKRNPALKCGLGHNKCSVTCSMFFSIISGTLMLGCMGFLTFKNSTQVCRMLVELDNKNIFSASVDFFFVVQIFTGLFFLYLPAYFILHYFILYYIMK